jgi:hypothetical protein
MLVEPAWIVGIAFVSAPVMQIESVHQLRAARGRWKGIWQALNNPDNWRRLSDRKLWQRAELRLRAIAGGVDEPAAARLDDSFVRAFGALACSSARALFLFGEADKEFLAFEAARRHLWSNLSAQARARLEVEIWPGEVHDGIRNIRRQKEIVERVLDWVMTFHPSSHASLGAASGASISSPHRSPPALVLERRS